VGTKNNINTSLNKTTVTNHRTLACWMSFSLEIAVAAMEKALLDYYGVTL
jgi:hypothetical protein